MPNMLKVNCKKIKEARERIGKSQAQLSLELNIKKNTYLKYEHGERIPPLDVARKIAKKLKLELADIYLNSEDLFIQSVNQPNDNLTFTTPYKYNYWHDSDNVEIIYPDNTRVEISVIDFLKTEAKIQDFIDMTFKNLLTENQK